MINKNISILIFLLILSSNLFPHEIEDNPKWKHYYRGSYIVNESQDYGFGGYLRLKRTTRYTFKDLRVFLHFIEGEYYKKIRYKDSSKFRDSTQFYNYSNDYIECIITPKKQVIFDYIKDNYN